MNRREALKLLTTGLPATASVSCARLNPSDVIVIETDDFLTDKMVENIKEGCAYVWPKNKAVVLQPGMKLKIVRDA